MVSLNVKYVKEILVIYQAYANIAKKFMKQDNLSVFNVTNFSLEENICKCTQNQDIRMLGMIALNVVESL